MSAILLYNANLVLEDRIEFGGLMIGEKRIARVFAGREVPAGLPVDRSIDLAGAYLTPGMIDIHIHGSAGVDVQQCDREQIAELSRFLLSEGVTGYFATFVPASETEYVSAISEIEAWIEAQDGSGHPAGARVLGIHFEGPFVNENRCGALKPALFRKYDGDPRSVDIFCGEPNHPSIRVMTLAPEVGGGIELIRELRSRGVRVFIGHSQAAPETLDQAVEAGAQHITHFPNALDPLHHRKPGAVGWGLLQKDVSLDCIADLQHVHPLMLRLIYQAKGADRVALISDAIQPAGMGDGLFTVWGEKITVRDGRTSLTGTTGQDTIAGSVITLRRALRNMIDLGVPVHEAVRMCSLVPARVVGIDRERGSIAAGKMADLIAYDEDFEVRLAVRDGRIS